MNGAFILAFVITPLLVLALGWSAVAFHEREVRRQKRAPGE
ncbi:hypothetical protein [Methylobacterium oxalidis]|nr:hypothetical protein [Methylobacterium oxalidis]GJE35458.1 hypothetical protein LDDCCGHA_5676 [Methylobacterium oxalidis]